MMSKVEAFTVAVLDILYNGNCEKLDRQFGWSRVNIMQGENMLDYNNDDNEPLFACRDFMHCGVCNTH